MLKHFKFFLGLFVGAVAAFVLLELRCTEPLPSASLTLSQNAKNTTTENNRQINVSEQKIETKQQQVGNRVEDKELQKIKTTLASYKSILEKNNLLPQTPEKIKATVEALKNKAALAIAAAKGQEILSVLKELQNLGPAGYDEALNVMNTIFEDLEKYGVNSRMDFYKALDSSLILYALGAGTPASEKIRNYAAQVAFYRVPETEANEVFSKILEGNFSSAEDQKLAGTLLGMLGRYSSEDLAGTLEKQINRFAANPELINTLVDSLGQMGFASSEIALQSLRNQSTDETLLAKIDLSLRSISPPATGVMVLSTIKKSNAEKAGIAQGDIITVYNGQKISSMSDLSQLLGNSSPDNMVEIEVLDANNQVKTIKIQGGELGFRPRNVKKD